MAGYIANAQRDDWCTPPLVVEIVRKAFDGTIDLDPCSNETSVVGAVENWVLPTDDGLVKRWGRRRVYVNSPFGKQKLPSWVAKARWEHEDAGAEICQLLPSNVDTRPWHEHIFPVAAAIGFFKGRLRFVGAPASAPMACALVYFGSEPVRFERAFEPHGRVVRP